MHLHLIRNTTPADAERHVDALPPARWRETADRHESAVTAAIAMQRSHSAASDQPVARIEAIRCPNADSEPCDYPACRCHQPAEAVSGIGFETPPASKGQRFGEAAGDAIGAALVGLLLFMGIAAYAGAPVIAWLSALGAHLF